MTVKQKMPAADWFLSALPKIDFIQSEKLKEKHFILIFHIPKNNICDFFEEKKPSTHPRFWVFEKTLMGITRSIDFYNTLHHFRAFIKIIFFCKRDLLLLHKENFFHKTYQSCVAFHTHSSVDLQGKKYHEKLLSVVEKIFDPMEKHILKWTDKRFKVFWMQWKQSWMNICFLLVLLLSAGQQER